MSLGRLLLRNLFFHWRGNLAVLLGVAVGSAVLTGALLVGDSLRGSLRDLTLQQLDWVDHALVTGRFIREELANELSAAQLSPVILLQGSASMKSPPVQNGTSQKSVRRAGRVTILGVDDRFWLDRRAGAGDLRSAGDEEFWKSADEQVVLNQALAGELAVALGDTVILHLQKISTIPRETLLGRRDEVVDELRLTVRAVLPDEGLGRFNLNPNPATPRNAFVPLRLLQAKLQQPKRINALLAGGGATDELQRQLRQHLTLDDWGLILHSPESRTQAIFDKLDRNHSGKLGSREWRGRVAKTFADAVDRNHDGVLERLEVSAFYHEHRNYLSLESRQLLLEPALAAAALAAAKETGLRPAPTLVYLANSIADGTHEIPYSVVAGLDPSLPAPLGPFLPEGVHELKDGEIILAGWKESPLQVQPGKEIRLTYYAPEVEGRLQEKTATCRLRGLVPLQGAANDPDLIPEFPGITDQLDIREWNPPFPYDNKRVKPRDERYWQEYRTTPKAYVTLADGQRLWGSRFGQLTSIRLSPANASDRRNLTKAADAFRQALLKHLRPEQGGLVFDDVRQRGLEASGGFTDFRWLFLSFSIFLIVAALLLVGLLVRLNLDRRADEIGILFATGYRRRTVRGLLLAEGACLAVAGGLVGLVGSLFYTGLMLTYFRARWPGGLDRSFLRLHATPPSLALGYATTLLVSLLTIAWALRILGRISPRALLAGETADTSSLGGQRRLPRWSPRVSGSAAVAALACVALGNFLHSQEEQALTFFSSGALLLSAGMAGSWAWLHRARQGRVQGHGGLALAWLGVRNAARYPLRSLLTAGLLACATFVIVAIQSFYRAPGKDFLDLHSGSGGFPLLGEADVPVYQDLSSPRGREELNFSDRTQKALEGVTIYPFRLRAGDDASCLNLYQPRRPRLLGVPHALIDRDGFQIKASEARSPQELQNPWLLLEQSRDDGAIPVFGEANTVEWMLHKGLGQEYEVSDERGEPVRLRFVGLLQDSIFQSELLLSESNFLKLYPRQEGYQFFLISTTPDRTSDVKALLETALADHGFSVTPTAQRLEAYLAVENTYLSTFQALGGLGLVLGALGLAIVLMRSVWERRGELAVLRALGYRESALGWLVLAENGFLLILGLAAGTLTALVAVAPQVLAGTGEVPWGQLLGLLALVLAVGLAAGAAALAVTLRAPLLPTLRRE